MDLVDRVADAVLYEGYILYPYRPSVKNRQRWTFGGLVPESFSAAHKGSDAWSMQTECLVVGNAGTALDIRVRFLHLLARQIGELTEPPEALPQDREPSCRPVESLRIGDEIHCTWQEAEERTVRLETAAVGELVRESQAHRFDFPARRQWEWLRSASGAPAGVMIRQQSAIAGAVELSAQDVGDGCFRIGVRILNRTPFEDAAHGSRDDALMRSLVSTHTILAVRQGEFVSLLDPPEELREAAAACRNEGAWPVLVGENGAKDTLLSSPIILYDYPQVAPESPGNFFDATEIDEMLTLRIMTMTDDEKQAMAAVDQRARELLQRTDSLGRDRFQALHGTMRDMKPVRPEADHG